MPGHRKNYGDDLKAKVALEAIRGQKTANEIAAEYGIHPTQIAQWKKQALYTPYSLESLSLIIEKLYNRTKA